MRKKSSLSRWAFYRRSTPENKAKGTKTMHLLDRSLLLPWAVLTLAFLVSACSSGTAQEPSSPTRSFGSDQPITEPVLFGEGIISTGDYELNAMFEADGNTVYFTKTTPDPRFSLMTIVVSHFEDGAWSRPEVVSFSGQYSEVDPFLAPDGNTLYYISKRPREGREPTDDFNIWAVDRTDAGWSAPRLLPAPINSDGDEYYPGVAANGTLYFSAQRDGGQGRFDLYRSQWVDGAYTEPENLGANVNSEGSEIDLYVAPDERYIIFVSYRQGGQGRGDLYLSYTRDGAWTPAENLGDTVNTSYREYTPVVSPDGRYLFFTSDRSFTSQSLEAPLSYEALEARLRSPRNGLGDIYYLDLSALNLEL